MIRLSFITTLNVSLHNILREQLNQQLTNSIFYYNFNNKNNNISSHSNTTSTTSIYTLWEDGLQIDWKILVPSEQINLGEHTACGSFA
jgi:hypothetical protein